MKTTDLKEVTSNWLVNKVESFQLSEQDLVEIFQSTLEKLDITDRKTASELTGLSHEGVRRYRKQYRFFNFYLTNIKQKP